MKNKIFCAVVFALLVGFFLCYPSKLIADSLVATPTTEITTNIGAWPDKIWRATKAHKLFMVGGIGYYSPCIVTPADTFKTFKDGFTLVVDPTVFQSSITAVAMDFMITEWNVSGHMHFDATDADTKKI